MAKSRVGFPFDRAWEISHASAGSAHLGRACNLSDSACTGREPVTLSDPQGSASRSGAHPPHGRPRTSLSGSGRSDDAHPVKSSRCRPAGSRHPPARRATDERDPGPAPHPVRPAARRQKPTHGIYAWDPMDYIHSGWRSERRSVCIRRASPARPRIESRRVTGRAVQSISNRPKLRSAIRGPTRCWFRSLSNEA